MQVWWDISEGDPEELPILGEKADVPDNSAPHHIVVAERGPVGPPDFAVATDIAGGPMVREGILGPGRGQAYVCGSAHHFDLIVRALGCYSTML